MKPNTSTQKAKPTQKNTKRNTKHKTKNMKFIKKQP
jgi:hypothetical protein